MVKKKIVLAMGSLMTSLSTYIPGVLACENGEGSGACVGHGAAEALGAGAATVGLIAGVIGIPIVVGIALYLRHKGSNV